MEFQSEAKQSDFVSIMHYTVFHEICQLLTAHNLQTDFLQLALTHPRCKPGQKSVQNQVVYSSLKSVNAKMSDWVTK